MPEEIYCELCGSPTGGRPYRALVDGVEMILCASCYLKLSRTGRAVLVSQKKPRKSLARPRRPRRLPLEAYDIVDDYYERIREAREARGWSTAVLAQKLRISESMLRKIEQGKLKPSIDLAKRMEKVLRIKLLEPLEDSEEYEYGGSTTVTLGDIVVVDSDEE